MNSWYEWARLAGVMLGAVGSWVFILYYGFTASWYRSETGRFLMLAGVGWTSLYTSGVVNTFVTSQVVSEAIRAFLIILAATIVWRSVLLYHKFRKEEKKGGNEDAVE